MARRLHSARVTDCTEKQYLTAPKNGVSIKAVAWCIFLEELSFKHPMPQAEHRQSEFEEHLPSESQQGSIDDQDVYSEKQAAFLISNNPLCQVGLHASDTPPPCADHASNRSNAHFTWSSPPLMRKCS